MSDLDNLRDLLDQLRHEIREGSLALAQYVRRYSDDPMAYAMADRLLIADRQERSMRLQLVNEHVLVH